MPEVEEGYCHCGCGGRTELARRNDKRSGRVKGKPQRYIFRHYSTPAGPKSPSWKGGKPIVLKNGYVAVYAPGHPKAVKRRVLEHILIAENALGRCLPEGAQVHHVNSVPSDNRPENLVICQDGAYHMLLHQRTRALLECGNAGWLKCSICGEYDDPANLWVSSGRKRYGRHRGCHAARARRRKQMLAAAAGETDHEDRAA